MTLLVAVFAAIITTIVWYNSEKMRKLYISTLMFIYWGASLMWLVDGIMEYAESGAEYFLPEASEMINDLFLGLCVAALGLIIWLVVLLIRDPSGVVKKALFKTEK